MSAPDGSVFPRLKRDQLSQDLKPLWDQSVERRGEAKFIAGMAQNPELLSWYLESFYKDIFHGGSIHGRYKELGRLRLSTNHGCRSCNQGNRLDALDAGLSENEIANIHDLEFEGFAKADVAVLKLADLMSLAAKPGSVLETPLYSDLNAFFTDAQILEMAMAFSILSGIARFIFAFDLAEKEDYCTF